MRDVIELRSGQRHRSSVYLLVDSLGRHVAGNLERWPSVQPGPDGRLDFAVDVTGDGETVQHRRGGAASFLLPGGFGLLVGRDVEDRLQIEAQIRRALGWGLALTLLLVLLLWFGGKWIVHLQGNVERRGAGWD